MYVSKTGNSVMYLGIARAVTSESFTAILKAG
jgi:hypothetical protein